MVSGDADGIPMPLLLLLRFCFCSRKLHDLGRRLLRSIG